MNKWNTIFRPYVICGLLGLLATGCFGCFEPSPGEKAQAAQKEEVEQLRQTFFQNEGNELRVAYTELEAIRDGWAKRRDKLAAVCRNINRYPDSDPDYRLWTERLGQINYDLSKLDVMAGDAFLAYAKFTLALDPVSEGRYQAALREGLAVAAELRAQYQALKAIKESG